MLRLRISDSPKVERASTDKCTQEKGVVNYHYANLSHEMQFCEMTRLCMQKVDST